MYIGRSKAITKIMPAVLFDNMQQQDAHEFLNYLLNTIADLLQGELTVFINGAKSILLVSPFLYLVLSLVFSRAEEIGSACRTDVDSRHLSRCSDQ